jgi:hypothetical protein
MTLRVSFGKEREGKKRKGTEERFTLFRAEALVYGIKAISRREFQTRN